MRRFLYLLIGAMMVIGLASCKEKPKVLKQGAMLYVNVKNPANMKAIIADVTPIEGDEFTRLTPRQLVEKAIVFCYLHRNDDGEIAESNVSIEDVQKDIEGERIKMWGEQVINKDGTLNEYFIGLRDVRVGIPIDEGDIGGYIPNSVMEEAEREIKKAYNEGRYDDVYRLFHEAYTAIPCTKAEWLALKEKGLQ
ncbi:hypothetical protein QYZ87_02655 [Porphyromonadaceae bacterium W3.11]|nr:hypothetical protein [Porphyromonadaceae bacterium W3.11]